MVALDLTGNFRISDAETQSGIVSYAIWATELLEPDRKAFSHSTECRFKIRLSRGKKTMVTGRQGG